MTRRTRAVGWLLTAGALWSSAHVSAQAPWSELRGVTGPTLWSGPRVMRTGVITVLEKATNGMKER